MKVLFVLPVIGTLAGCEIQSQEAFDAQPFDTTVGVSRQYQAVYADVLRGARQCWGVGPVVAAMPQAYQLDAQLYPDLGYGEVYSYGAGTVFAPQALVRIERSGAGATVSVRTGRIAGSQALFVQPALHWAEGNIGC